MSDEIPIRVMENDTPETNEKEWPIWPPNTRGEMFVVPSDFARKLERERDEARNDLEFRREVYRVQENYLELARQERDEARRARDVALKAAHTYDEAHTKACEGWAQAERERDDLRERYESALKERDSWRMRAEEKWAMRRELEELLGVNHAAASDEQFQKGLNRLKEIIRERDDLRDRLNELLNRPALV